MSTILRQVLNCEVDLSSFERKPPSSSALTYHAHIGHDDAHIGHN
jgi:hypothetical protein